MPILSQITFLFSAYSCSLVVIVLGSRRSDEFLIIPLGFFRPKSLSDPEGNKELCAGCKLAAAAAQMAAL